MPAAPPPFDELLARLVAFDTTSRNSNLPLARFLADLLDRPGVTVRELPSPDEEKANLFVRVGPPLDDAGAESDGARRPGLVLSGHMDVVPADDVDRWTSEPFSLADRGDRWVGRGTADMKGFLALATRLAAGLEPDHLRHPLVLLFTYDEEVGCLGAAHLHQTWDRVVGEPLPTATVIGEPTGLLPVSVHKGHLKLRLTWPGVSAHSAYPHLGVNAIERAAEGVRALVRLKEELAAERVDSSVRFPQVPYAALNVGTIRGGAAVNVVPDRCVAELGIRLLPGMDAADLESRVRAAVAGSDPPPEIEVLSASPPLETADGAEVLGALLAATGERRPGAVSFATDGGWLSRLGLDCVIWGPGSIEVAHKPDEWLPKAEVATAEEILAALAHRFCGAPAPVRGPSAPTLEPAGGRR